MSFDKHEPRLASNTASTLTGIIENSTSLAEFSNQGAASSTDPNKVVPAGQAIGALALLVDHRTAGAGGVSWQRGARLPT
jgi:hypothetical protein